MRNKKAIYCLLSVFVTCIMACGISFGLLPASANEKQAKDFFSVTANAEIIANYQAPSHLGDYKGIFVN